LTTPSINLLSGAIKYIKATIGVGLEKEDVIKKRYTICEGCEHMTKQKKFLSQTNVELKKLGKCSLCGCFLMKKIVLKNEKCLDGRW